MFCLVGGMNLKEFE